MGRKGEKGVIYLQLFLSFLQIGAFSFGGGYAAMPLIEEQVVTLHNWISSAEFVDLVTISQMTPGPIAVNAATFVGTRIAGLPGALVATLGCVLPSCILVTVLAMLYARYRTLSLLQGTLQALRPAVVAMIASAGLSILLSSFFGGDMVLFTMTNVDVRAVIYFAVSLYFLQRRHVNPILVMSLCGVTEVAVTLLQPLLT